MQQILDTIISYGFVHDIQLYGGNCYLVGGVVRDHLLGIPNKDIDLLVTGVPVDDLIDILKPYGKVDQIGESFGIVKLITKDRKLDLDIALPRTEVNTGEGHRDFEVKVDHKLPIEIDLARRDFTINSIAVDMYGNYIDPFDGMDDIFNKIIRATNTTAFTDDPLRILRAFQFSARFGFTIDADTQWRMRYSMKSLQSITSERVYAELYKLTSKGDARFVMDTMLGLGVHVHLLDKYFWMEPHFYKYTEPYHGRIESVAQLLLVLCNFSSTRLHSEDHTKGVYSLKQIGHELRLSTHDVQELSVIYKLTSPNIYNSEVTLRSTLFTESKKWPGIWNTDFFNVPLQLTWFQRLMKKYFNRMPTSSMSMRQVGFYNIHSTLQDFNSGKYPKSYKELDITSEELSELGYIGVDLGNIYVKITTEIFADRIENTNFAIRNFLQSKTNISYV